MLQRAIGHESRGPPRWRVFVTVVREHRWIEIDPGVHPREGVRPLEAMSHWRDPAERLRSLRCRRGNLFSTITRRRVEGFRCLRTATPVGRASEAMRERGYRFDIFLRHSRWI
jgi:hypothetical protein